MWYFGSLSFQLIRRSSLKFLEIPKARKAYRFVYAYMNTWDRGKLQNRQLEVLYTACKGQYRESVIRLEPRKLT